MQGLFRVSKPTFAYQTSQLTFIVGDRLIVGSELPVVCSREAVDHAVVVRFYGKEGAPSKPHALINADDQVKENTRAPPQCEEGGQALYLERGPGAVPLFPVCPAKIHACLLLD